MRLLRDGRGADMVEYVAVAGLVLAAAGAAVWALYHAVAQKFREIEGQL